MVGLAEQPPSSGGSRSRTNIQVVFVTRLLAETDELRRRLVQIERIAAGHQSSVQDDSQSADSWSAVSPRSQSSQAPHQSSPSSHGPPKFYTVTRTAHDYGHMLGIHFCPFDELLSGLNMTTGPTGKVEDWKGNHFKSTGTFAKSRDYWYREEHKKGPPTHGC